MAKRNSNSGRRTNRTSEKPTSGRSKSAPKKFGRRDETPKDKKPFNRESSERPVRAAKSGGFKSNRPEGGRPFKKSDRSEGTDEGKRFGRGRNQTTGDSTKRFGKSGDRERSTGTEKPFNKGERNSDRPEKKFDRSEARKSASFGKPYKKKPYVNKSEGDGNFRPKKKSASTPKSEQKSSDPDLIRLNRYMSTSGLCSRREADEYITMGLVSVNGEVVTELGFKVKKTDEVRFEDKVLKAEKPVYILMNKPKGFITTTQDPQERNTVMHILGDAVRERVYPVGRLDRNTTGLLLLTNDGELADRLMHPSYNARKIYKVELDKPMSKADFKKLVEEGVRLEEGRATVDDAAIISDDGKTVGVEIHIGWNRVVRRIFESMDYQVVKLDRTVYAGLDKKDLARGQWRYLTKEEIVMLKHYKNS